MTSRDTLEKRARVEHLQSLDCSGEIMEGLPLVLHDVHEESGPDFFHGLGEV